MLNLKIKKKDRFKLDVAPLVDIVFLLLIFFMLTSTFIKQEGMDIEMPGAESSQLVQKQTINILIDKTNTVRVGTRKVDISDLVSILREKVMADPKLVLMIEADKIIPFESFARVLDAAKLSGAMNIVVGTEHRENPGMAG